MLKKIVGTVVLVIVIGAAWFFTQGPGKEMLNKSQVPESAAVDTGKPTPEPQPAAQPAPAPSPVQSQPVEVVPTPAPDPAASGDASQDRGMKFLLNQGKGN